MRALKEELVVEDAKPCSVESQNYQQILEDELKKLNHVERKAIYMRFWVPCSIAQIATELHVTWDAADQIIDHAVEKMRDGFRQHKYYSRNLKPEGA